MRLGDFFGLDSLSPAKIDKTIAESGMACAFEICPSDNPVGIEVEAEGFSLDAFAGLGYYRTVQKLFAQVPDGSLRDRGIEFVSAPLRPQDMAFALTLIDKLNQDLRLKYTDHTGLHVHVNVRELDVDKLRTFIALYILVEDGMFNFSGNRQHSIFCVPVRRAGHGIPDLFSAKYHRAPMEDRLGMSMTGKKAQKYMALNYLPLKNLGTLEFRHMAGTKDIKKICDWISLIVRMHSFAAITPYSQIQDVIFALNTNSQYENFLQTVLKGNYDCFMDVNRPIFIKDMETGVGLLKEWSIDDARVHSLVRDSKEKEKATKLGDDPWDKLVKPRLGQRKMIIDEFVLEPPKPARDIPAIMHPWVRALSPEQKRHIPQFLLEFDDTAYASVDDFLRSPPADFIWDNYNVEFREDFREKLREMAENRRINFLPKAFGFSHVMKMFANLLIKRQKQEMVEVRQNMLNQAANIPDRVQVNEGIRMDELGNVNPNQVFPMPVDPVVLLVEVKRVRKNQDDF